MVKTAVRFTPADRLTAGFAGLLTLVGLLRWSAVDAPQAVAAMAAAAALPFLAVWLRGRFPSAPFPVRVGLDFYFAVSVFVVFDNLGPFIRAVHPVDRDAWLIAADRALFGTDPTVALAAIASPHLSDVLLVCYALYFFHPIILAGLIYRDDLRRDGAARRFPRYAFTAVFTFFLSYVGYFCVPAIGPRFTVTHPEPLPRGPVARVLDDTLNRLEKNKRNCFPSGHTMVTIVVLIEAARRSRRTLLGFLPFALGLVFATVYGRYHYVVDVLAGFALAFAVVPFARRLFERMPNGFVEEPSPAT